MARSVEADESASRAWQSQDDLVPRKPLVLAVQVAAHRGDQAHGAAEIVRPGGSRRSVAKSARTAISMSVKKHFASSSGVSRPRIAGAASLPGDHCVDGGGELDPGAQEVRFRLRRLNAGAVARSRPNRPNSPRRGQSAKKRESASVGGARAELWYVTQLSVWRG